MRLWLTTLSQPKTSKPKRKSGPPIGPTISWSKVKCFALGLTVAHQWKLRKNGEACTDWKAVLPVINAIYLQEFEDFRAIYPNGLPKSNKLRSEYSDRDRGRHDKWLLRQDQCTTQELREMLRMREIVFETERRLSQMPDSLVVSPRPGAADWVWYEVKPSEPAAQEPKPKPKSKPKRKRKAKVQWESESEDDDDEEDENSGEEDDDDENEKEDSEERDDGDDNDEQERSTDNGADEEESSSASDDASDTGRDGDNIAVARRTTRLPPVVEDEDEDAERVNDEEEILNAADAIRAIRKKAGHNRPRARQTQPQRMKTRLNEVQNADEDDEEPVHSRFFLDAFEDGAYGNVAYNPQTVHTDQSGNSLQTVSNLELLPTFALQGDGALDNAIIQAEGATTIGNHTGMYITPVKQDELIRRHKQSDMQALGHDEAMMFKGLAPPNYPPIQQLHDRPMYPPRGHYRTSTTQPLSNSYKVFRRTLIAVFQAHRRIDFWAETERIQSQWNIIKDLIDPMVATTGMSRADVSKAIIIAAKNQVDSSIEFGQLLIMPTKIDQSKGEPNGTLDNIVQRINRQPKLQMIHTNDVNFATQPPTYTIRKHKNGSGSDFRRVRSHETLYSQTGEVRRVLLTDETTGQGREVDVMLCDKQICEECEPREENFAYNFDYAEQRRQLPLVHHKDVVMLEDKNLYFAPMQQGPVLDGASVIKRDIHEVIFGHGFSRVIFCDKARCRACKGASCVADLVYRDTR